MHIVKQFLVIALLSAYSFSANAAVIEQAPLDGGDGSLSLGPAGIQIAADNFQFSNDVQLTSISWWGSYDPNAPVGESFSVRIFEDNGSGNPAVNFLLETTFTGTGDSSAGFVDLFGGTVFQYNANVNQSLQGGVDYYLSIFNNDNQQDWFWLASAVGSNEGWSRAADGDAWNFDVNALNMSFRLSTANVPEPATLFLIMLPLLWLALRKKRLGDSTNWKIIKCCSS